MDLKDISPKETAVLDLVHPIDKTPLKKDDGDPMSITLYGAETNAYKKKMHELRRKFLLSKDATFEDGEEFALEMLVAVTANWDIQLDGKNPKCVEKAIRDLYTAQPWIRDQVDVFVHDRANFLSVASTG